MAVGLIPTPDLRRGPAVLFGLPGNPVAVMVTFLAFVRPALLRMMGCNPACAAPPPLLRATSVDAIRKKPGRTEYQRGRVEPSAGALPRVRIAGNQGSGVLEFDGRGQRPGGAGPRPGERGAGRHGSDVMVFDGVV